VPHIRKFLEEALAELGFTICECTQVGEPSAVLDGQAPDLIFAGLLPSCLDFCTI
jgi:DNA-binding response OmpR family regulator